MPDLSGAPLILHASAVAVDGRGLLIRGASGSGKSSLALQMMALGATLVADDRVCLYRRASGVWLSAPDTIRGLIEARGLGLLHATETEAALHTVLDLDTDETERLPPLRRTELLEHSVPLLHNPASGGFAAALMQYLRAGRRHV